VLKTSGSSNTSATGLLAGPSTRALNATISGLEKEFALALRNITAERTNLMASAKNAELAVQEKNPDSVPLEVSADLPAQNPVATVGDNVASSSFPAPKDGVIDENKSERGIAKANKPAESSTLTEGPAQVVEQEPKSSEVQSVTAILTIYLSYQLMNLQKPTDSFRLYGRFSSR